MSKQAVSLMAFHTPRSHEEQTQLRSHFLISNLGNGGRRTAAVTRQSHSRWQVAPGPMLRFHSGSQPLGFHRDKCYSDPRADQSSGSHKALGRGKWRLSECPSRICQAAEVDSRHSTGTSACHTHLHASSPSLHCLQPLP